MGVLAASSPTDWAAHTMASARGPEYMASPRRWPGAQRLRKGRLVVTVPGGLGRAVGVEEGGDGIGIQLQVGGVGLMASPMRPGIGSR